MQQFGIVGMLKAVEASGDVADEHRFAKSSWATLDIFMVSTMS